MKLNFGKFLNNGGDRKLVIFLIILFFFSVKAMTQGCTPIDPVLFGQAPDPGEAFIYCKNSSVGFGVNESVDGQKYSFTVHAPNGTLLQSKGGPLDGNGGTLSVSTFMLSARDVGEYRVTTNVEGCAQTKTVSFYAFYGGIDDLSITSWGSNSVSFNWASSGFNPVTYPTAVTYEYVVSTIAIPDDAGPYQTTTNNFATRTMLANNTVYYIHVRVKEVNWPGNEFNPIDVYFGCEDNVPLGWQTLKFTACTAVQPAVGTITPVDTVACQGSAATFTATAGYPTYAWYMNNNTTPIAGANSRIFNSATLAGQYRVYVTTGNICQGMIRSGTLTLTSLLAGTFSGGGNFFNGDTVRLGISNTMPSQTYKVLKDGVEVYSVPGIGTVEFDNSEDTLWYKFAITSAAQAGLYTIRTSNPYCAAIDFGSQVVNFVTALTICPGATDSLSFLSQGANTIFKWQVDAASGTFVDVINSAIYSGAATYKLKLTNPPIGFYGYKYRCVTTGSASPVTSSTRILRFGATWTGATSTAWNTASNWNCGVPTPTLDAVIPRILGPSPRYPVLSSSISIKAIQVRSGATFIVNPGVILTVTGQ